VKYLVDANVLSEATKEKPEPQALDWLSEHELELAVNPIILGELEYGILLLPVGRRRERLQEWFQQGAAILQVLDFDRETARAWASLLAQLKRKGRAMPIKDSLIAATALQHQLSIATRNIADYRHTVIPLVNPFTK